MMAGYIFSGEKVRVGLTGYYDPVLMDLADPPYGVRTGILKPGDKVKIVTMRNAPPPGMMGMCYVNNAAGEFAGLISVRSITKEKPDGEITD
jgi:hypothetical protein